ncbi:unnamed protein product [Linum tenue]|uniref:Uncharacterized protein n=1 Tax=Linum tenue TaxID=586396 RepID=A0AAV0MI30_9ROSI|nr:unnamed protein product [Linum tenue]
MEAAHLWERTPAHVRSSSSSPHPAEGIGPEIRARDEPAARGGGQRGHLLPRGCQIGAENPRLGLRFQAQSPGRPHHLLWLQGHRLRALRGVLAADAEDLHRGAAQRKARCFVPLYQGGGGLYSHLSHSSRCNCEG